MSTLAPEYVDELAERLEELTSGDDHTYLPHFVHADGSVTVIVNDTAFDTESPREHDHVATLIRGDRDHTDLDSPDGQLEAAVDRWGAEDEKVQRYVAIFRPDIALYVPRWEVTGYSQGDYSYGWGYVLVEDLLERGFVHSDDDVAKYLTGGVDEVVNVREIFDAEISTYQDWFRGDVYGAYHLEPGDPIVAYGEHGAYVAGRKVVEDTCWGFFSYESYAQIAEQMTCSAIVETHS